MLLNFQANLGALYIPPVATDNFDQFATQPTPPWMAQRPSDKERAEWSNADEQYQGARPAPPPNRWGSSNGETLVSPTPDRYQNQNQNLTYANNTANSGSNGPKVCLNSRKINFL